MDEAWAKDARDNMENFPGDLRIREFPSCGMHRHESPGKVNWGSAGVRIAWNDPGPAPSWACTTYHETAEC